MTYYVIRQIATGILFPATRKGSTHAEFLVRGMPRLFASQQAAKNCLRWWLEGATVCIRSGGGIWDEYDERMETTPMPDRIPGDYEIVKAELSV